MSVYVLDAVTTPALTNELPRLNDPGDSERNYRAVTNVDISSEDASKTNPSSNGVTTDILKENNKGKDKS
jgi:hypothetical protein